jgi:hypothetical protein
MSSALTLGSTGLAGAVSGRVTYLTSGTVLQALPIRVEMIAIAVSNFFIADSLLRDMMVLTLA